MEKFLRLLLLLCLLSVHRLSAQIQTIYPADNGQISLNKINYNFSFLASSKVARWSGSGAPGSFPLSVLGDQYVDITNKVTYTCYALSACSGVSSSNWVINSGGGGSGVSTFNGRNGTVVPVSGDYTTALVTESGNLYYTNARARAAISATAPVVYDNSTGIVSLNLYGSGSRPVAASALGTSGNCMQWGAAGATDSGAPCSSSAGSVTSVGLALPNIFSVSGSPVTSTGTLTGTLATQAANLVWAGPTTGSAATPTFRSLVSADIGFSVATAVALSATPTQCSGSQYATGIAANGNANCGTPAGSGTVTHTAGALTSTAIVTGNGGADVQTPAATATMDSSGNVSTPGTVTTGAGVSGAGLVIPGVGTQSVSSAPTNSTGLIGPATQTGKHFVQLPNTASTAKQFPFSLSGESSGANVLSWLSMLGTGSNPVAANSLGTSGNCAQWGAAGLTDAGAPCGSGSSSTGTVVASCPSDGTTDATSCLQTWATSLVDTSPSSHLGKWGVIPAGQYLLSNSIVLFNVKGLKITVAGDTQFLWAGPTGSGPATGTGMFVFNNVRNSWLEFGTIFGSSSFQMDAAVKFANVQANQPYSSIIVYPIGAIITSSGTIYVSLQNPNQNHTPASSPTYWRASGSAWSSGTAYMPGEQVTNGGNTYVAMTPGTNHTPATAGNTPTYWSLLPGSFIDPGHNTVANTDVQAVAGYINACFQHAYISNANSDMHLYLNDLCENQAGAAWSLEHTNSFSHVILNSQCYSNSTGKACIAGNTAGTVAATGTFFWWGAICVGSTTADFFLGGSQAPSSVKDYTSENSARMVVSDGPSGAAVGFSCDNCAFRPAGLLAADGIFIKWQYAGPFTISNSPNLGDFTLGVGTGTKMKIYWSYLGFGNFQPIFAIYNSSILGGDSTNATVFTNILPTETKGFYTVTTNGGTYNQLDIQNNTVQCLSVTGTYTAGIRDQCIQVTSGNPFTITLPSSVYDADRTVGSLIRIVDLTGSAGTNTITISAGAGTSISGTANITSNYGYTELIFNPTTDKYIVLGHR